MAEGSGLKLMNITIAQSFFFIAPNQVNVNRDMFEMVPASNDRVR